MTFRRISVLVPTRGRVARLQTLLQSYYATASGHLSEIVFRADNDDRDTLAYLAQCNHVTIVGPRLQGYRSLPTFFNDMLRASTGDVLLCGNDDMVFRTPGWAEQVLDVANCYPDGVFDIGVRTFNESHYPFAIVSRRLTEVLGFIWDPRLFWGDVYLRDVMQAVGRCVPLPAVHIDHDWIGHAPDQTFRDGRQEDPSNWSQAYWVRHAEIVSEAVMKVREMLSCT